MAEPATDRQLAFIRRLADERETPVAGRDRREAHTIARFEDSLETGEDARCISKAEARRVIDWLLTQPLTAQGQVANMASDKQVALIARLATERIFEDSPGSMRPGNNASVDAIRKVMAGEPITKHEASHTIEYLFGCGERPRTAGFQVEPGVYKVDGEVFIVKPNREKTRVYAKRLVELTDAQGDRLAETGEHVRVEFEYAPGAIHRIRPEHRMSVEEGKALTIRYGRCICCGRKLKVAQSVERGIGPVCITYFASEVAV